MTHTAEQPEPLIAQPASELRGARAVAVQRNVSQRQPLWGVKNADGTMFYPLPSSKRKCPKCHRLMGWVVALNSDGTLGEESRVCYSCPNVWWPWLKPKRKLANSLI
jgi:hypothetical protein